MSGEGGLGGGVRMTLYTQLRACRGSRGRHGKYGLFALRPPDRESRGALGPKAMVAMVTTYNTPTYKGGGGVHVFGPALLVAPPPPFAGCCWEDVGGGYGRWCLVAGEG